MTMLCVKGLRVVCEKNVCKRVVCVCVTKLCVVKELCMCALSMYKTYNIIGKRDEE